MSESENLGDLKAQLAEKDVVISSLKEKTKAYIQKMQADHEAALRAEKTNTQTLAVQ